MFKLYFSCLLACLMGLLGVSELHAQRIENPFKPNLIEISYPLHRFSDGPDFKWWLVWPNSIRWYRSRSGISYTRVFAEKGYCVELGYEQFYIRYPSVDKNGNVFQRGDIFIRYPKFYSLGYLYPLIYDKRLAVWPTIGGVYRTGGENFVILQTPQELFSDSHAHKDLGMYAGIKLSTSLPYNFLLSGQLAYQYYFYIYDKGDNGQYPYDPGSGNQLLSIQVKLGYQFDDFWMRWVKRHKVE